MEPSIVFQPGTYYVGDLGFVLPHEDLRMLFNSVMTDRLRTGIHDLIASARWENDLLVFDPYWVAALKNRCGTLYDQDNNGWGYDWKCFGVAPWKWIESKGSYKPNKIEFNEPFDCSFNNENIIIGHLNFTFNPK